MSGLGPLDVFWGELESRCYDLRGLLGAVVDASLLVEADGKGSRGDMLHAVN